MSDSPTSNDTFEKFGELTFEQAFGNIDKLLRQPTDEIIGINTADSVNSVNTRSSFLPDVETDDDRNYIEEFLQGEWLKQQHQGDNVGVVGGNPAPNPTPSPTLNYPQQPNYTHLVPQQTPSYTQSLDFQSGVFGSSGSLGQNSGFDGLGQNGGLSQVPPQQPTPQPPNHLFASPHFRSALKSGIKRLTAGKKKTFNISPLIDVNGRHNLFKSIPRYAHTANVVNQRNEVKNVQTAAMKKAAQISQLNTAEMHAKARLDFNLCIAEMENDMVRDTIATGFAVILNNGVLHNTNREKAERLMDGALDIAKHLAMTGSVKHLTVNSPFAAIPDDITGHSLSARTGEVKSIVETSINAIRSQCELGQLETEVLFDFSNPQVEVDVILAHFYNTFVILLDLITWFLTKPTPVEKVFRITFVTLATIAFEGFNAYLQNAFSTDLYGDSRISTVMNSWNSGIKQALAKLEEVQQDNNNNQ